MTLAELPLFQAGIIAEILPECKGLQRNRLLDLGFVPGAEVVPELKSPVGDTTAYRIKNALIALRSEQAREIILRPEKINEKDCLK